MAWRVLHIVASSRGGGAALVLDLCRSLDRDRFSLGVALSEDGGQVTRDQIAAAGAKFIPLHIASGFRLSEIRRLRMLIKDYDLVHVHGPRAALFSRLAAIGLRSRPRIVFGIHGFGAIHYSAMKRTLLLTLDRALSRLTDRVICDSAQERQLVIRARIFPAERVCAIDNGIDPADYQAPIGFNRAAYRSKVGFSADTQLIVTICRLHPQKDIATLLKAMAQIRSEFPQARLWIIGDGPQRAELENLASALHLNDSVIFAGFRFDMREVLNATDLFVLATHWEGMPLILLAALAVGLPVIASDVVGVSDVLSNTGAGILVPPADPNALAHALRDQLKAAQANREMGERARALIRSRFTLERMAQQTAEVYQALLSGRNK